MRTRVVDLAPETDVDALAEIAYELAEKVRDESPIRVRNELLVLSERHPLKAAQLLMVLAVWFDPTTTTAELWERTESVARSRVHTEHLQRGA